MIEPNEDQGYVVYVGFSTPTTAFRGAQRWMKLRQHSPIKVVSITIAESEISGWSFTVRYVPKQQEERKEIRIQPTIETTLPPGYTRPTQEEIEQWAKENRYSKEA